MERIHLTLRVTRVSTNLRIMILSFIARIHLALRTDRSYLRVSLIRARACKLLAIADRTYTGGVNTSLTGIGMATPQWIEPIVYQFSNRWIKGEVESEVPSSQTSRIGADKAISISLDIFPAAKVRWIEAPANLQGTYMVRLKQAAEPSDRFPKTFVWIDQFSGKVHYGIKTVGVGETSGVGVGLHSKSVRRSLKISVRPISRPLSLVATN